MNLRTVGIASVVFALSALTYAAEGQNTDPRSVLKRYIEAQNSGELDAALGLWADDGVIINTRGRKVAGKENLRKFIQTNISRKIRQEPEAIQTVGEKVTWINRESNESYSKLNVAPVQQNSEVLVRDGKIISWVNYFPSGEIARIEQACSTPQAQGVLLNDQPCSQFIEQAKAQTASVTGVGKSEKR
ncbi:MAG TPA: nuclear transport factor 2 family protein [Candidatus Binatia bacterium]